MLAFLADEDLHGPIINGLGLHHPELDVVRAIDVGLGGMDDDVLLSWAVANGRITVSHDVSTMIKAANRRVAAGLPMTGLIVIPQSLGIGKAVSDLCFVAKVCSPEEMSAATVWLPL
jgi:hypothetical protein